MLLVDGDIGSKGNRLEILKGEFEDKLEIMPGKEIENLLPEEVLKATAIELYKNKRIEVADPDYESKINQLSYSKYSTSTNGIGYHLDRALGLKGKGKDTTRIFAEQSGTIKDKVNFAIKATNIMNTTSWELTPEISLLCDKIFEHIKIANK